MSDIVQEHANKAIKATLRKRTQNLPLKIQSTYVILLTKFTVSDFNRNFLLYRTMLFTVDKICRLYLSFYNLKDLQFDLYHKINSYNLI